jgi:hypothetical protein
VFLTIRDQSLNVLLLGLKWMSNLIVAEKRLSAAVVLLTLTTRKLTVTEQNIERRADKKIVIQQISLTIVQLKDLVIDVLLAHSTM